MSTASFANVATYDPAQVLISIGGQSISGYADGTFVLIARNQDTFTKYVGSSGEVARVKTNDFSGSFTFTLMQTSPSNTYLTSLMVADEELNAGVAPILVTDLSTNSQYVASNAWIRKPPDSAFSREYSTREWVFDASNITMTINGTVNVTPV